MRNRIPSAFALLGLCLLRVDASTIQNFEIVRASDLSPVGGVLRSPFLAPEGSFFGTFSVDTSNLPQTSSFIPIASAKVSTTAGGSFPATNYLSGSWDVFGTFFAPDGVRITEYEFEFSQPGQISLDLYFLADVGSFAGGQIVYATEVGSGFLNSRSDGYGDAVALDPAFLAPATGTPEPFSIWLSGAGLILGAILIQPTWGLVDNQSGNTRTPATRLPAVPVESPWERGSATVS